MTQKIEKITESLTLGEGPHWDNETQALYFVDCSECSIHKYVPSTKKHTKAVIPDARVISLILPIRGHPGKFLITRGAELIVIAWNGENNGVSVIEIIHELKGNPHVRYNDGKCDPTGRLWLGTLNEENMERPDGSLYSFQDGLFKTHLTGIKISNGLAFREDLKKMYYIDSLKTTVDEYDFDVTNGIIKNGKPIFTLAKHDIPGLPDGMCIDVDGYLWVAIFNGARVIKIDPRHPETLVDTIFLPAKQITSVSFGGADLNELYVTSARIAFKGEPAPSSPEDGATFRITGLDAKGTSGVSVLLK